MPGLSANQVVLSEVLEVRGGPLYEDELWAVLYESCDSVKDMFLRGNASQLQDTLRTLNLDSIILCGTGKIRFGTDVDDGVTLDRRFIAPERFMTRSEDMNDIGLEKMFVYTLGMVIYAGANFGDRSVAELCLSTELETLLLYMCEDDPFCRCNLVQVFQACNSRKDIYLSVERIKSMVTSILGNDIPMDDSTSFSDILSTSSSILKICSPAHGYSYPLPLGSLQPLKALNSTRVDEAINDRGLASRNGHVSKYHRDSSPPSPLMRTNRSADTGGSEESYEPLRKVPEHVRERKPVAMETKLPVAEDTLRRSEGSLQEARLKDLPPVKKIASVPRDSGKVTSAYATPNFKRLMTVEKRKLAKDGFYDESRSKIKFVDSRYKSMPTLLNSTEQESPRSGKDSVRSAEYPLVQPKESYRKLTRLASKDSMDSASIATSQYSSAISLNYGSYTLDSQNAGRWPSSFYGGASNGSSGLSGVGSFERISDPRFGGPEFIIFPRTPELCVIDITPARLGPMPRGRRKISVMLPTAQRVETVIEASAIAKEVFDQVADYLGLKETMYFGLTQINDSEHFFLDLESKLTKYAPNGWKDDKKNRIDFILHFKVKFFLENVSYLRHYKTRHLFYMQLRREILCGYLFCPEEAAASLASLALQAEFSDYIEQYHGRCYFEADHYLPGRVLSRMTRSDIYHQLPLLHHSYRGLREDEAEFKFMKEAQRLKEYGTLFYQVSRNKKDETDSVLLGICPKGVVLYEVRGQMKTEIHRQLWHMIKKFSFTRKKFVVEPKKGIGLPVLSLYTSSYKKAKYLLRMCQSFHRFSQLSQPRSIHSDNGGSMVYSFKSSGGEENADSQKENKAPNVSRLTSSGEETARRTTLATSQQERFAGDFNSQPKDFHGGDNSERAAKLPSEARQSKTGKAAAKIGEGSSLPTKHNLDDGSNDFSGSQVVDDDVLEEFSPATRRRLSTLRGVPDRMTNTITLRRRPGQGLGITIVGGEDSNRLGTGIFIKSIISGGLAAKEGKLQKGDRILSVNGTSLDQVSHDEAAKILKDSVGDVKIVVSQFKSPGTSFLDQSGLSMLDKEDFSITPKSVQSHNARQVNKSDKSEHLKNALTLSPIVAEAPDEAKVLPTEVVTRKSSRLARCRVINEDELTMQEVPVEESEVFAEGDQLFDSAHYPSNDALAENAEVSPAKPSYDEDTAVILQKKNNSFGMTVTGGAGSAFPFHGVYVHSIEPGGPVDQEGIMKVGDCILSMNGIDLSNVSRKQAVRILQQAPVQSKFVISKKLSMPASEFQTIRVKPPIDVSRLSGDESSRSNSSGKDAFVVQIDKGIGGLGLSLAGGAGSPPEFKDRLMVRRLFPGQPAATSGKLRIGDVIRAVNGVKIAGYTQQEAINLLRREKFAVKLLVKRPHPNDIPEELLIETPRESLDPKSVLENIQKKISIEAVRRMPNAPSMNTTSEGSADIRMQSAEGDDIIPYAEKVTTLEAELAAADGVRPNHISTHEVLVHAQMSGPRPNKVLDEDRCDPDSGRKSQLGSDVSLRDAANASASESEQHPTDDNPQVEVLDDLSSHNLSLPELEESTVSSQGHVQDEKTGINDGLLINQLETPLSLSELEQVISFSQDRFPDEEIDVPIHLPSNPPGLDLSTQKNPSNPPGRDLSTQKKEEPASVLQAQPAEEIIVPTNFTEDQASHDLSLPELPSAEEMVGLKLPEPILQDTKDGDSERSRTRARFQDQLSETSSITDLDFSSDEEGLRLRLGSLNEDSLPFDGTKIGLAVSSPVTAEVPAPDSPMEMEETTSITRGSSKGSFGATQTNPTYFQVSLTKGATGLGFTLKGGKSTTGGCFIEEIVSDPAKSCGKLENGDRIVMVDSVDISEYEHMDAVEVLRGTKSRVLLGIERKAKSENSGERSLGYEMITLNRNSRGRIGLVLGTENGEIIVEDTVPEEPAALSSTLRHGDLVKEINEISLVGLSLEDANGVLEEAVPIVQLAVQRRKQASRESRYALGGNSTKAHANGTNMFGDGTKTSATERKISSEALLKFARSDSWRSDSTVSSSQKKNSITNSPVLKRLEVTQDGYQSTRFRKSSSMDDKGEIVIVQLEKGTSGFGMSLTGHNDLGHKDGAFIANINPGGVTAKSGKLRPGDKVISINGENVESKQQKDVVEILRNSSGRLSLEVYRYPMRLFSTPARASSIASSTHSDDNHLAEMDFHLTEESSLADPAVTSDNILSFLSRLNEPESAELSEHEKGAQGTVNLEEDPSDAKARDSLRLDLHRNESNKSDRLSDYFDRDAKNNVVTSVEETQLAPDLTGKSFESGNSLNCDGFEDEITVDDVARQIQDLSWNDSDLSDEDNHMPSKEEKPVIGSEIKKSSVSTGNIAQKKGAGMPDGTTQDASFSSTLEKVTPSSSIVSSILDEISPVHSSDEESDFDFSSSLLPDMSSFTLEDREAFEKYHNKKDDMKSASSKCEDAEGRDAAKNSHVTIENNGDARDGVSQDSTESGDQEMIPRLARLKIDDEKPLEFQEPSGSNHKETVPGSSIDLDESSWMEDSESGDESFNQGLRSLEADSSDVLMALEEYETREKEEFNDTLKDQIAKESVLRETSFTEVDGRETTKAGSGTSISQSSTVQRQFHTESKIPKLDAAKLTQGSSPSRKSPARSGIPVFSPPRSPAKSTRNIELVERSVGTGIDKASHAETAFTDGGNRDVDAGEANGNRFETKVEVRTESDLSSESEDELALSITRDSFSFGQEDLDLKITHFQATLDSDDIDREFQEVKELKSTDSCDVARRSANRDKNRFRSILPFDKTRVCLAGGEEKDYINANHVKFNAAGMSFHYIAAQGPLSNTVDDFWRMIWEQRVETIVMLTKDVEGGKVKCHRYWPDLPGLPIKASDRFRVDLMHRKESGNQIERQFSLLNTKLNKSVTINHLLYTSWPEVGIPKEPLPILMFVKNSTEFHTTGPLLVHCSAGTGRTGLFIMADILNKILPIEAKTDVLALVKSLKQQRQSLIQTKDQYTFCYKMAVEVLQEEKHLTY